MKKCSIKIDDCNWLISVAANRREGVIDALLKHDAVLTAVSHCTIGEQDGERIKVLVSERIDGEDAVEIERIAREGGEPEKPQRHPILDDVWTLDSLGRLVTRKGQYAENIYGQDVLIRVPDLLRKLEEYLKTGSNWTAIRSVMARMGL